MELSKRMKDLTGMQFGSLTAISPSHLDKGSVVWNYKCKCGNSHKARATEVSYQAKKGAKDNPSCGCYNIKKSTKHGYKSAKTPHPLYGTYRSMLTRCYNPNDPSYKHYGAIGVTVAPEWLNNPKAFIEWGLANGWEPKLSLDKDILCKKLNIYPRIYSPSTCQFIPITDNIGESSNRSNYLTNNHIIVSEAQVEEIKQLYLSGQVTSTRQLADMFGYASTSSIRKILNTIK